MLEEIEDDFFGGGILRSCKEKTDNFQAQRFHQQACDRSNNSIEFDMRMRPVRVGLYCHLRDAEQSGASFVVCNGTHGDVFRCQCRHRHAQRAHQTTLSLGEEIASTTMLTAVHLAYVRCK